MAPVGNSTHNVHQHHQHHHHHHQHQKSLSELKVELKKYTKRFLAYFVLTLADTILGSLLFLYIEHCYDSVPPRLSAMELAYLFICDNMENIKDEGLFNTTVIQTYGNSSVGNFTNIREMCEKRDEIEPRIACELTLKTFSKWFEYTASIAFTTGYGHVVTNSDTGKIVTMFYLIPTIASTIVTYIQAANVLICVSKIIVLLIERHIRHLERVKYYTEKVFMLQLLVTTILIIGSSLFYSYNGIEEMTFLDSLYFTLTSLTTIGFGDFTLDFSRYLEKNIHLFIILSFLWFFGMGMVASIIAGLGEIVAKYKFEDLYNKIKSLLGCEVNEPPTHVTSHHHHHYHSHPKIVVTTSEYENNNNKAKPKDHLTIPNEHVDPNQKDNFSNIMKTNATDST